MEIARDHGGVAAIAPGLPRRAAAAAGIHLLQQQVSTYLLYRSFSTDDRNRRGLQWWREARRRHTEQQP
jgi:hypothetical protein